MCTGHVGRPWVRVLAESTAPCQYQLAAMWVRYFGHQPYWAFRQLKPQSNSNYNIGEMPCQNPQVSSSRTLNSQNHEHGKMVALSHWVFVMLWGITRWGRMGIQSRATAQEHLCKLRHILLATCECMCVWEREIQTVWAIPLFILWMSTWHDSNVGDINLFGELVSHLATLGMILLLKVVYFHI